MQLQRMTPFRNYTSQFKARNKAPLQHLNIAKKMKAIWSNGFLELPLLQHECKGGWSGKPPGCYSAVFTAQQDTLPI